MVWRGGGGYMTGSGGGAKFIFFPESYCAFGVGSRMTMRFDQILKKPP